MSHVIPPAPTVAVPIVASVARFPVRRIYCVGRKTRRMRAKWVSARW